jgi:hypothetical protein
MDLAQKFASDNARNSDRDQCEGCCIVPPADLNTMCMRRFCSARPDSLSQHIVGDNVTSGHIIATHSGRVENRRQQEEVTQ